MTVKQLTRYTGSHGQSALYVNGVLDQVGDHHTIDLRIAELAGVIEVTSDDFMRGRSRQDEVAPTLRAATAYTAQKALVAQQAASLQDRLAAKRRLGE